MVREWNTIPVRTTRNIVHWRNKIYPIRHKNSSFFGFPAAGRILPLWCLLTASPFFHKKKDRRRIHTNPSTRRLPPDTAISRKSVDSMPSSCQLEYRRNELKNFEKKSARSWDRGKKGHASYCDGAAAAASSQSSHVDYPLVVVFR